MPKAIEASTTSRRVMLGFTGATALVAGLTTPVLGKGATNQPPPLNADAGLIAICDQFFHLDDRLLKYDTGELDMDEDEVGRMWSPHFVLIDQITSIAAETHKERIAKAKVALAVMRYAGEVESEAYDNLVRAALRDVIAGSAVA